MTADTLPQVIKNKLSFVDGLSKAVGDKVGGIESLDYAVAFRTTPQVNYCSAEYLVVHYKGGAIQARNCSGNSNAAILEELTKMVYSSQVYPEDTQAFSELVQDDRYDLFDIESI